MSKKRILIVTNPAGSGHIQVAKLISQKLSENNDIEFEVFDMMEPQKYLRSKFILGTYLKSYKYKSLENFYAWIYYNYESLYDKKLLRAMLDYGKKRFFKKVDEFKPDVIINTFPLVASYKMEQLGYKIPLYTVVTDYHVNSTWISKSCKKTFVPTDTVKQQLLESEISSDKIVVSGIPIKQQFFKEINTSEIKQKTKLLNNKPTIVVFAGTHGVLPNVKKICKAILEQSDVNMIVVCGKNEKLYKKLQKLNLENLKIYGYVDNMEELLAISDLVITKPGGIGITEIASIGVPMIFPNPAKGQEGENGKFFENSNASIITDGLNETIKVANEIIKDKPKLSFMKDALAKIPNKDALDVIVNTILKEMESK